LIEGLYADLDKLYRDESLSSEQKIQRRAEIFDQLLAPFRERYPKITILKSINNAEIVQLKLYLTELLLFQQLFEKEGRNWSHFISRIREIQSAIDRDSSLDPFTLLKDMVKAPHE
jgi:predicted aminopeptidase